MNRVVGLLVVPVALATAVLVVWATANAFDEELSTEAKATLSAGEPTAGSVTEDNGYFWMTSLAAPANEDPVAFARARLEAVRAGTAVSDLKPLRLPDDAKCKPDEAACFPVDSTRVAAIESTLKELADRERRASKMRAAKDFSEVLGPAGFHAPLPDLRGVIYAQQIAFAKARLAAARGDWETAVATLEADAAFNRRVLGSVRSIVSKIVAARAVGWSALFAVQLWRAHGAELEVYQTRLATLAADLSTAQLSLSECLDQEITLYTRDIQLHGRESLARFAGDTNAQKYGLRGEIEMLFYLPNATANLVVARAESQRPALNGVTGSFDAARKAIVRRPMDEGTAWYEYLSLRNPVGAYVVGAGPIDYTHYQASLHDLRALLTLIRARISLPPMATADDWKRLVATEAFLDPYTGQALTIDAQQSQPAIAARRSDGWPKSMLTATGGKLVAEAGTY